MDRLATWARRLGDERRLRAVLMAAVATMLVAGVAAVAGGNDAEPATVALDAGTTTTTAPPAGEGQTATTDTAAPTTVAPSTSAPTTTSTSSTTSSTTTTAPPRPTGRTVTTYPVPPELHLELILERTEFPDDQPIRGQLVATNTTDHEYTLYSPHMCSHTNALALGDEWVGGRPGQACATKPAETTWQPRERKTYDLWFDPFASGHDGSGHRHRLPPGAYDAVAGFIRSGGYILAPPVQVHIR